MVWGLALAPICLICTSFFLSHSLVSLAISEMLRIKKPVITDTSSAICYLLEMEWLNFRKAK